MRGHWIGGTRKLNKHWQDGGRKPEFSRWFTTIKIGDNYYQFAPSYHRPTEVRLKYKTSSIGSVYPQYKNTWTSLNDFTLVPSFDSHMTATGTYTLEDVRENGTINTQTLTASSRVKVIIPTFRLSINFAGPSTGPLLVPPAYRYDTQPVIPTGAEILWQDDNLFDTYKNRYSDSLSIVRNTWNGWEYESFNAGSLLKEIVSRDYYAYDGEVVAGLCVGYYDHNTASSGVPDAINLLSPVMRQLFSGTYSALIQPFNTYYLYDGATHDYGDGKNYQIWYKLELVSLAVEERTII